MFSCRCHTNKDARQCALFYECLGYSFEKTSLGTNYIDKAAHRYEFSYEPKNKNSQ